MNINCSYSFAPHDIYNEDPESGGDRILVIRQWEPLPVHQTKYKFKKEWSHALRFRYFIRLNTNKKIKLFFLFSVTDELEVIVLKRIERRNSSAGRSEFSNLAPPHDDGAGAISSSQEDRAKEIDTPIVAKMSIPFYQTRIARSSVLMKSLMAVVYKW